MTDRLQKDLSEESPLEQGREEMRTSSHTDVTHTLIEEDTPIAFYNSDPIDLEGDSFVLAEEARLKSESITQDEAWAEREQSRAGIQFGRE